MISNKKVVTIIKVIIEWLRSVLLGISSGLIIMMIMVDKKFMMTKFLVSIIGFLLVIILQLMHRIYFKK